MKCGYAQSIAVRMIRANDSIGTGFRTSWRIPAAAARL